MQNTEAEEGKRETREKEKLKEGARRTGKRRKLKRTGGRVLESWKQYLKDKAGEILKRREGKRRKKRAK
jgi:hypothetical protein